MASLGERTCKVCGGLDGKRFKLSEKQEGVNFPPVHPNCRCTTIGYDPDDDIAELENKQEQLSYEEWYQQYVEGREQKRIESKDAVAVELPSGSPRPVVSGGNAADVSINSLTNGGNGGTIKVNKIYSFEEYAHNSLLLAECDPAEMYELFINAGLQVLPLGNGSFKGVSFEQGGGYRVFFDNSMQKMLMYHPESRSHHGGAYFKLSEGKFGTHRYNLDGTEKEG